MDIEELIKNHHTGDVAWDEIRERRVFNRIREELAVPTRRYYSVPKVAFGTLGGIAVLLLIGFIVSQSMSDSRKSLITSAAPAVSILEPAQAAKPSFMVIGGVGQVKLIEGARVTIWEQTTQVVKLQQTQGKAVYDIDHRDGREVFVYASGVKVRVVGTVFTVAIQDETVSVHVDRGVVRIDDGNRLVELRAGETIGVATRRSERDPEGEAPENHDADTKLAENEQVWEFDIDEIQDTHGRPKDSGDDREVIGKVGRRDKYNSQLKRSTKQLFDEVDQARNNSDFDKASEILKVIVARKDDRSSVLSALFVLGKVERAKKRYVRAAKAFSKCFKLGSNGPLAEDALAEEAAAWSEAKNIDNAKEAAESYLERYPRGIHTERMNLIILK